MGDAEANKSGAGQRLLYGPTDIAPNFYPARDVDSDGFAHLGGLKVTL